MTEAHLNGPERVQRYSQAAAWDEIRAAIASAPWPDGLEVELGAGLTAAVMPILARLVDQARAEARAEGAVSQMVQGRCPACGNGHLFLGSGGYVTCPSLDCPNPCAPSEALGVEFPEPRFLPADGGGEEK